MYLVRISRPSIEPVSLEDAKNHLRVDYDDEDAAITNFITAAREKLERRCGRAFVSQVWEARFEGFSDEITIPVPPTISLDTFTYIDTDGDEQTVSSSLYAFIDGGEDVSEIIRMGTWPTAVALRPDAVRVRFTAGYDPTDESPANLIQNVPDALKQAILWTVGSMFEHRESVQILRSSQEFGEIPDSVQTLIAPYIVPRI